MKLDFNLNRFNSVLDELIAEADEESKANPRMLLSEAKVLTAQFQNQIIQKEFFGTVQNIITGVMLMPADSVALLLATGYRMGQEDSRAASEVADLNKLFNLEG